MVRRRLLSSGLYARRPVVCIPFYRRQRRANLSWASEHVSWTTQRWAFVLFTDESGYTLESDSGHLISGLLIWREQSTRNPQSNTVERHSYQGGTIMVRVWISLGCHTDLHVSQEGTLSAVKYWDEIRDPYVHPYVGANGHDFLLMDDNALTHQAVTVEEYLEGLGLE
ncbi:transposable element Tcb2 transposase [Trichonephila clavipes]|nr:transposable element Tcb2 transposase [Trichonephila clavipes]